MSVVFSSEEEISKMSKEDRRCKNRIIRYLARNRPLLDKKLSINDKYLYRNFLEVIRKIILQIERSHKDEGYDYFYSRKDKLYLMYKMFKKEILKDKNKKVIELCLKYGKYNFKPFLYQEKRRLLFLLYQLQLYFQNIYKQLNKEEPKKPEKLILDKTLNEDISKKKLSKYTKKNYTKTLEKIRISFIPLWYTSRVMIKD
ncbi:3035_t:CDS:2, partial [Scutellospora calospora]